MFPVLLSRAGLSALLVGFCLASVAVWAVSPGANNAVVLLDVPAGPEAGMYSLAAGPNGAAYLSWLEPSGSGLAFRCSSLERGRWTTPRTIEHGPHLFSNWADHPSIAAVGDGSLVAQWPVVNPGKPAPGSYNNSIRIAVSRDRGTTWKRVFSDGEDNIHSYSGFVSLLPARAGFSAVYLTPPRPISHDSADHTMTLSHATVDAEGQASGPSVIDDDVCSCCPTAFALTSEGPIAAYRDHQPGEVRDIAVVRLVQGQWTAPRPVHRDRWVINGCPTNGPELAADGRRVAAAWFTAAGDLPRMQLALSDDAGASFGPPTVIAEGGPVGRGALVMMPDRSAVVAWLAATGQGTGTGHLLLRKVDSSGQPGKLVSVGAASPGRLSGMPQMVRHGASLLAAWRGERGLMTALVPSSMF